MVTYSLGVVVNKSKSKSSLFCFGNPYVLATVDRCGQPPPRYELIWFCCRTLSTPLIYRPRSRPPISPPPPLHPVTFTPRLDSQAGWQAFATTVKAKPLFKGAPSDLRDIETKLYLHTTRIFPIIESILFYLSFLSSSSTLAAFMPFGPQTPGSAGSSVFGGYQCTRIRLTRQVIVDAKNTNVRAQTAQRELGRNRASSLSGPINSSSEMWDTTTIGEGSFKLFVSSLYPPSKQRPFSRVRTLLNSFALLSPFAGSGIFDLLSLLWTCYQPGVRVPLGLKPPDPLGGSVRTTGRIGSLFMVRYLSLMRSRYLGLKPLDYSSG